MLYSGARKPLVFLATDFLKSEKRASFPLSDLILSSASLTLTKGLFSETIFLAKETAPPSRSSSLAISSTSPISRHWLAGTCSPLVIITNAFAAPTILGNLCVPPAPGNSPKLTSGRPHLEEGTAIL